MAETTTARRRYQYDHVIAVGCPYCGQSAGQKCQAAKGYPVHIPHDDRWRAARRAREGAPTVADTATVRLHRFPITCEHPVHVLVTHQHATRTTWCACGKVSVPWAGQAHVTWHEQPVHDEFGRVAGYRRHTRGDCPCHRGGTVTIHTTALAAARSDA